MPRPLRFCPAGHTVHVVSVGTTATSVSPAMNILLHLLNCIRYIKLNPVRAGMTSDSGDYHWSSYCCHAFGHAAQIWSPHADYLRPGTNPSDRAQAYRHIIGEVLPTDTIHKIRYCLNTGLVLGSEAFRDQVATLRR